MAKTQRLTDGQRNALMPEWEQRPSPNPRYRGLTPAEVARTLVRKPAKEPPKNDFPAK